MLRSRVTIALIGVLTGCAAPAVVSEQVVAIEERGETEPPAPSSATFAGLWQTTYGTLRLDLSDSRATGSYSYDDGAEVEGVVEDDLLRLRYREHDGTMGCALFRMNATGDRLDGVWREGEGALDLADASLPRWNGERITAVPGRTWLVILEVHWEESLREHEYSYGSMLRAFFERLPDVAVRHRFVHDRADLVRFLKEIAELPEPAIVYVSSHGSPEGVQAADGTIDGKTIGETLRGAGSIELLHFGACSALRGDFAEQARSANAPHAPFPISGYRRDADWAGSAIVDFTYLDLILERGMSPQDAVQEVRRSLEFATDSNREEAAIPAIDLVIH